MAKTPTIPDVLRRGDKVVATTDLRDVPEGTAGKVAVVNGFSWIRYWVRFENDVVLGSINRRDLATPAELRIRAAGGGAAAVDTESADGDTGDDGGDGADGGGVTTASGTIVPQKLIDRSAAARARLAA